MPGAERGAVTQAESSRGPFLAHVCHSVSSHGNTAHVIGQQSVIGGQLIPVVLSSRCANVDSVLLCSHPGRGNRV